MSDAWGTPQDVFDALDREFRFTLDPCATPELAKCPRYFTKTDDGLRQTWSGERVFMNPPYASREIDAWLRKANYEARANDVLVVALIPVKADQAWWHDVLQYADELRFVRGRIRFVGDGCGRTPFASAIAIYRNRRRRRGDGLRVRSIDMPSTEEVLLP